MSNSVRGRRRNWNYPLGSKIPFGWKVAGLVLLAAIAAVAVVVAVRIT